eukprot:5655961-Lingulodinium_polyedra.AAC.1
MFYCQIPKVGQLVCGGSREVFHDYRVNPEWSANLAQAEKTTAQTARPHTCRAPPAEFGPPRSRRRRSSRPCRAAWA